VQPNQRDAVEIGSMTTKSGLDHKEKTLVRIQPLALSFTVQYGRTYYALVQVQRRIRLIRFIWDLSHARVVATDGTTPFARMASRLDRWDCRELANQ